MDLHRIPNKLDWIAPLIVAFLSLIISGYASYTKTDKDYEHRITAVETQQSNTDKRLDHIEHKLDTVLERLPEK